MKVSTPTSSRVSKTHSFRDSKSQVPNVYFQELQNSQLSNHSFKDCNLRRRTNDQGTSSCRLPLSRFRRDPKILRRFPRPPPRRHARDQGKQGAGTRRAAYIFSDG